MNALFLLSIAPQHPEKNALCLKVPRFFPLALVVRSVIGYRCVWNIGGVTQTRENQSTLTKDCPGATVSTINLKRTSLGSRPVLNGETSAMLRGNSKIKPHDVYKDTVPTSHRTEFFY